MSTAAPPGRRAGVGDGASAAAARPSAPGPSASSAGCCARRPSSSWCSSPRTRSATRSSCRCRTSTCASRTRAASSASTTTSTVLTSPLWWQTVFNTTFVMVISVAIELVLGMILALVMHRAIFGRGVVRTVGPDPVRDHHRRRRVRVVLRLRPGHRLRQQPAVHRRRQGLVRRALLLVRRDHHRRDLEDDAVHGAAAAGRPDDDRRGPLRGRARSTARPPGSASTRSRCRCMKPAIVVALLFRTLDAFRVFDSIFVMTRGAQDTAVGVDPRLRPADLAAEPRPRLRGLRPDLPDGAGDRVRLREAASAPRRRAARGRSDEQRQPAVALRLDRRDRHRVFSRCSR